MSFGQSLLRYFLLGLLAANVPFIFIGMTQGFTVVVFAAFFMTLFKYYGYVRSNQKVVLCALGSGVAAFLLEALIYGGVNLESFKTFMSVYFRFGLIPLMVWVSLLVFSFNYQISIVKRIVRE